MLFHKTNHTQVITLHERSNAFGDIHFQNKPGQFFFGGGGGSPVNMLRPPVPLEMVFVKTAIKAKVRVHMGSFCGAEGAMKFSWPLSTRHFGIFVLIFARTTIFG